MTAGPTTKRPIDAHNAAQAEGGGAAVLTAPNVVPAHLLDGGEVVLFAIKPSPWFVVLASLRWLALGVGLMVVAKYTYVPAMWRWYLSYLGLWIIVFRLVWATLEWVSRLYVLTNRRVMRLRGVFNVELFECSLDRVQNTFVGATFAERLVRIGTVTVETAGRAGRGTWLMIARPLEVHERLREAICRSQNRGGNGL